MVLQKMERLLLIFICLVSGHQAVFAATDTTGMSEAHHTTEAPITVTETHPYTLGNTTADDPTTAAASAGGSVTMTTAAATDVKTTSAGLMPTMTSAQTTGGVYSADDWSNGSSTVEGGGGGSGEGGGRGDGGSTSNATATSTTLTGNQTANATTPPTVSPIFCYNCSGGNCTNINSDNSYTCISNTGICYIQYDTAAMTITLACKPLYATSGVCLSNYASQAAKTNCEFCCKTNRCNSKTSTEIGQTCLQLLQSSASQHLGLSATILTLIAAMRWLLLYPDITAY